MKHAFKVVSAVAAAVCALAGGAEVAWAQANPELAPVSKVTEQAVARQRDASAVRTNVQEGQRLLAQDVVQLDGYAYCGQAMSLAEHGDFRQSIRAASKALYLGQRDKKPDLVAVAHRDLAIAYLYAGKLDEAEQYARSALAVVGSSAEQVQAPAHKVLGDVLARRKNHAAALSEYEQSLKLASAKYRPQVQISLANTLQAAGRPADALVQLQAIERVAQVELGAFYLRSLANALLAADKPEEALAVYDQLADDQSADADYQRLWAYAGAGKIQLARNERDKALASYLKATALADDMRAKFRSEEYRTGLFGDVQNVYDQALKLAVEQKDYASAWALSEASRSRQLLDSVRERASDTFGKPMGLAQLQAQLRPNEGVLEFHAIGDQMVVWVVRHDGLQGKTLSLPQEALTQEVDDFRKSIIERKRDAESRGQALYTKLMAPLDLTGVQRLFIVPHGSLHYLPFQALHDGKGYLVARASMAVWPSASVGGQLWARPQTKISALMAFGNPATTENVPLPGAEREVNQVADLFKQKQIYVQRDATKLTFKQHANESAVLHVAAHAEVDEIDPLFSRILLANDGQDRGLLEAREVYQMNLGGVSLVTLSACESGLGKVLKGDEIVGFTRSFLSAGASSMVASLWPVADDSTEALMTRMYQSMGEGADLMDAMRNAQMDVQKKRRFAHPFFWAPFNVIGNGRMQLGS